MNHNSFEKLIIDKSIFDYEVQEIIGLLITSIHNRQKNILTKQLKSLGYSVTSEQFNILWSLYQKNGQYQKQLGENTFKDKPNITRMLDVLEKDGLIERRADVSDRRKFTIFITEKGIEIVKEILPLIIKNKEVIRTFLSIKEEDNLRNILKKFESAIDHIEKNFLTLFLVFSMCSLPTQAREIYNLPQANKPQEILKKEKVKEPISAEEILLEKPSILEREFNGDLEILKELGLIGTKEKEEKETGAATSMVEKIKTEETMEEIDKELQDYLELKFQPITLEQCLTTALENNYDIKIVTAQKDTSKWSFYKSITEFFPYIDYDYVFNRRSGEFLIGDIVPAFVHVTPIRSTWTLDWDFLRGLERVFNTQAAKRRFEASKENLEFEKDSTLEEVTRLYYRLLQRKLNNQVLTRNLKEREAQLKINNQRFEAGVETRFNVLRAEAEVARAKQDLVASYNLVRLAQASLTNVLGIDVFTPIYPVEEEVAKATLVDKNLKVDLISKIAMEMRNDLKSERLKMKAAKSDRKAAYSTYIPNINMLGIIQDAGTNNIKFRRGYQLGVFADWQGGRGAGLFGITDIKEKDAIYKEQKYKTINLARDIQENVITSFYASKAFEENIKAAKEEYESATESLKLAFLQLEAGIGIFIDVLQAQAAAVQAKINLIEVTIDYNIAQSNLLFNSGLISVNNILEGYNVAQEKEEAEIEQTPQSDYKKQEKSYSEKGKTPSNGQDPRYPNARPQGLPSDRKIRPSIAQPSVD